jgi:hypothetical protein
VKERQHTAPLEGEKQSAGETACPTVGNTRLAVVAQALSPNAAYFAGCGQPAQIVGRAILPAAAF